MQSATSAQATEPFTYDSSRLEEPESQFRLLELFPSAEFTADLVCRILVASLNRPSRPFKAVSYVWGDGSKKHHAYVSERPDDGEPVKLRLPITSSLNTALRHLRHEHDSVTLWIDQICINQSDGVEKSHQVRLMGRIYSSASQVLVWLGEAEHQSDVLMEAWRSIGQAARDLDLESYFNPERLPGLLRMMQNVDPEDDMTARYQELLRRAAEVFAPLHKDGTIRAWLARPWFGRAWVTQEFCLCPDTVLVCGLQMMPAELLLLALHCLRNSIPRCREVYLPEGTQAELQAVAEPDYRPVWNLLSCRMRWQRLLRREPNAAGDQLHSLLRKMYVNRNTQATEHRDRIYSLLGLAVDADVLGIIPDYTNPGNDGTARILTDAARAMITNSTSGRIDILCYSQFPKTPALADHLPTWVSDWRANLRKSFYEVNEFVDTHYFAACGSRLTLEPVPSTRPDVLGLRGWLVDTVEMVSPGGPWDNFDWNPSGVLGYLSQLDALFGIAMAKQTTGSRSAYASPTRRAEARWRVPIADVYWDPEHEQRRAPPEAALYHRQLLEYLSFHVGLTGLSPVEQEARLAEGNWAERHRNGEVGALYQFSMSEYAIGKKPFMTENGYLGMGPAEARAGDVVAVFCGGRIPFVVRPSTGISRSETGIFAFIGEAYCDGIMDGETAVEAHIQDIFLE